MKNNGVVEQARELSKVYRIEDGSKFRLQDVEPGSTSPLGDEGKKEAKDALEKGIEALAKLQDMLYAQDRWAILFIFQAMDAAGKDGAIKHVMSGINPQGCQVSSFKAPSAEELDHDFMWRCTRALPERGRIGIFNRSYYEEVLVVRVHQEFLKAQKLPDGLISKDIWAHRYQDIRAYEEYLARNGMVIRKFFLHVSPEEQKKRFLERIDDPAKNWKFAAGDVRERGLWKDYMNAYEEMIRNTATKHAPWYVVPADNKWFTRAVVAAAAVEALASIDLHYPKLQGQQLEQLEIAKKALLDE